MTVDVTSLKEDMWEVILLTSLLSVYEGVHVTLYLNSRFVKELFVREENM